MTRRSRAEGGGAGGDQRDGSNGERENAPGYGGGGSGGSEVVDVDEEATLGPFILEGAGDEVRTVEVTEGLLE